jgi:uncharacterized membrane protein (UPF0127 family)
VNAVRPVRKQTLYRVTNATRHIELAMAAKKTTNPLSRGVGLMFRRGLPPGGGLIIQPCSGVVSFFMRFPIDVVFLTSDGEVCHQIRRLRPWRMSKVCRRSKLVVELPPGTLDNTGTVPGDRVAIEPA